MGEQECLLGSMITGEAVPINALLCPCNFVQSQDLKNLQTSHEVEKVWSSFTM